MHGTVKDENEPQFDGELIDHLKRVCDELDETAELLQAAHDGELLAYDGNLWAKIVNETGKQLADVATALRFRAEMDGNRRRKVTAGVRRGDGGRGRVEIDDPYNPSGLLTSLDKDRPPRRPPDPEPADESDDE